MSYQSQFAPLAEAFLARLGAVKGLTDEDYHYLYEDTKDKLAQVLRTAQGLAALETTPRSRGAARSPSTAGRTAPPPSVGTAVGSSSTHLVGSDALRKVHNVRASRSGVGRVVSRCPQSPHVPRRSLRAA